MESMKKKPPLAESRELWAELAGIASVILALVLANAWFRLIANVPGVLTHRLLVLAGFVSLLATASVLLTRRNRLRHLAAIFIWFAALFATSHVLAGTSLLYRRWHVMSPDNWESLLLRLCGGICIIFLAIWYRRRSAVGRSTNKTDGM
jgi:hypothetical protein